MLVIGREDGLTTLTTKRISPGNGGTQMLKEKLLLFLNAPVAKKWDSSKGAVHARRRKVPGAPLLLLVLTTPWLPRDQWQVFGHPSPLLLDPVSCLSSEL